MIISISGVPGTGKSDIAKNLSKKLHARLIIINDLIKNKEIIYNFDSRRKTKVVDIKHVQKAVDKHIINGINIVEGHLSHLIKSDIVIVLRANPKKLVKRLEGRKWKKSKIIENVQAEMLDAVTIEAIENNKNVFEIDASNLTPEKASKIICNILKNSSMRKKYVPGKIDWTEKYASYLVGKIKGKR